MPRTTINLSDERYRALKQAAARRGQTITEIVDQALELAGVNTRESIMEMLAKARRRSGLSADAAMELALRETRAYRDEQVAARTVARETGRAAGEVASSPGEGESQAPRS